MDSLITCLKISCCVLCSMRSSKKYNYLTPHIRIYLVLQMIVIKRFTRLFLAFTLMFFECGCDDCSCGTAQAVTLYNPRDNYKFYAWIVALRLTVVRDDAFIKMSNRRGFYNFIIEEHDI